MRKIPKKGGQKGHFGIFFSRLGPPENLGMKQPAHLGELLFNLLPLSPINMMQSYPARALDRKLQVDWARVAREGPRVLMSLRVDFGPMGEVRAHLSL